MGCACIDSARPRAEYLGEQVVKLCDWRGSGVQASIDVEVVASGRGASGMYSLLSTTTTSSWGRSICYGYELRGVWRLDGSAVLRRNCTGSGAVVSRRDGALTLG